jgi:hypothetical protein
MEFELVGLALAALGSDHSHSNYPVMNEVNRQRFTPH